jgi:hypothetical protein
MIATTLMTKMKIDTEHMGTTEGSAPISSFGNRAYLSFLCPDVGARFVRIRGWSSEPELIQRQQKVASPTRNPNMRRNNGHGATAFANSINSGSDASGCGKSALEPSLANVSTQPG